MLNVDKIRKKWFILCIGSELQNFGVALSVIPEAFKKLEKVLCWGAAI